MNKSKKIAMSVVSIVMAGALIVPLAACEPDNGGGGKALRRSKDVPVTRFNASASEIETKNGVSVLKSDNTKLAYPSGTQINVNIIDSANLDRKISYDSGQIATYWNAIDGYTYFVGDLKPAWWQLGQDLGIKFNDVAQSGRKSKELSTAVSSGELARYTLINASNSEISAEKGKGTLLDLADYLDYMPNFKNFLSEYPIVEWSLKMDTNGGMYYIPYFDGNDDIEKYEMVQRDWVKAILDEDLPTTDNSITYLAQYKAKGHNNANTVTPAVQPFMGTTGSWSVATTKLDGSGVGTLTVSYDDVIAALTSNSSDLYKAITAINGVDNIQTSSGNIVDIQNDIITKTNGAVKGSELIKVLREYVKVAYKLDNAAYTKLSDVFLSASAGWDADLLTALFRCVVTNFKSFTGLSNASAGEIYALAGREAIPQRDNDLIALAGELYGVRGLESKLEYLYIDNEGVLQDARLDEASYEAAYKLHALAEEGLLYNVAGSTAKSVVKSYKAGSVTTFMLHDYVQTQTKDGFSKDTFDLAPIVTPVSLWDDNGDSSKEPMRFTESWRSVKNSGVVIPKAAVSNPNVLSAVLTFVDYLFSNDGQIIGSYGPMSTNGNAVDDPDVAGYTGANGFWYGKDGVDVIERDAEGKALVDETTGHLKVKAAYKDKVMTADGYQYFLKPAERGNGFMYGNVLYKGLQYKTDKQIPIMTTNNSDFYLGGEVNGVAMNTENQLGYKKSHVGSYTDYARGVVGAALPIGNKDQGFEYQCTADCGLDGAKIVSVALGNGTIKHVVQTLDKNNWWYTIAPSALPVDDQTSTAISAGNSKLNGTDSSNGIFNSTGGKDLSNVYIDLAFYGYDTSIMIGTCGKTTLSGGTRMAANATDLIATIKALGYTAAAGKGFLEYRVGAYKEAWNSLKAKV